VILVSAEDKGVEGYRFYATVLGNLGFKVRVFYEEADALNWLLDPHSESE